MNMMALFTRPAALAVAIVCCCSGLARAAVIWRGDFEAGDFAQWNGNINAVKGTKKNIEFVTDPVQQGKSAAKFTIYPEDTFAATQQRVQLTRNQASTAEGADTFMSWYILLATEPLIRDNIAYWESNGSNRNMMTWWVAPKMGGGTTIGFGTQNLGREMRWSADLTLNKWHQIAVHIHWSVNPAVGAIKMFFDGNMVLDIKVQTKADGNTLFFQAGYHRANVSQLVDSYFVDNFIQADNLAEVLAPPTPAGDGGVPADSGAGGSGGGSSDAGGGGSGGGGSGGSGTGGISGGSGGSGGVSGTGGSGGVSGSGGSAPPADAGPGPGVVDGGAAMCAVGSGGAPGAGSWMILLASIGFALFVRRRPSR